MNKLTKTISAIVGLLTIVDIVLRNVSSTDQLKFLIAPLFSVNILEIAILLLLVSIAYNFLPKRLRRYFSYLRAKKFYNNWKEFKSILKEYSETQNSELQKRYENVREKLEEDFNFFAPSIYNIQKATHRKKIEAVIERFEWCFKVGKISEWQNKIQRKIPEEIDVFDHLLISLKEDCKKPERPYTSANYLYSSQGE